MNIFDSNAYLALSCREGTGGSCTNDPAAITCNPPKILSFPFRCLQMSSTSSITFALSNPISSMIRT